MRQLRSNNGPDDAIMSLNERKRLLLLIKNLVREVERLNEDNAQLRAAVTIYKELARQSSEDRP